MPSFEGCPYEIFGPLATAGVDEWMRDNGLAGEVANAIENHLRGQWGSVADPEQNDEALVSGGQLLSVWEIADETVWVISDPPLDNGVRVVTALFPSEY